MTSMNIQSLTLLDKKQMTHVKGGVATQAIINAGAVANVNSVAQAAVDMAASVVLDDKRPPRPGGGISTL